MRVEGVGGECNEDGRARGRRIQDITYMFLRNFLIFDSNGCILLTKRARLKISGLKRIDDVIYKIRRRCF